MSDLRANVEELRRGDADYIYGKRDPEFCEAWNAAIDSVLDLIPESSALVVEADLTEALYSIHSWAIETARSEAGAIMRALTPRLDR